MWFIFILALEAIFLYQIEDMFDSITKKEEKNQVVYILLFM